MSGTGDSGPVTIPDGLAPPVPPESETVESEISQLTTLVQNLTRELPNEFREVHSKLKKVAADVGSTLEQVRLFVPRLTSVEQEQQRLNDEQIRIKERLAALEDGASAAG